MRRTRKRKENQAIRRQAVSAVDDLTSKTRSTATHDDSHKSSSVALPALSVIVDVDLVVDAQALTLTAAKRHVVVDSTVVLARRPAPRCEPLIRDYEGLGRRWGQTSAYRCTAVDVKDGVKVQVDVKTRNRLVTDHGTSRSDDTITYVAAGNQRRRLVTNRQRSTSTCSDLVRCLIDTLQPGLASVWRRTSSASGCSASAEAAATTL